MCDAFLFKCGRTALGVWGELLGDFLLFNGGALVVPPGLALAVALRFGAPLRPLHVTGRFTAFLGFFFLRLGLYSSPLDSSSSVVSLLFPSTSASSLFSLLSELSLLSSEGSLEGSSAAAGSLQVSLSSELSSELSSHPVLEGMGPLVRI